MFSKLGHVCYLIMNYILKICHFYLFIDCEALKVGDNNILECKGMKKIIYFN